MHEREVDRLAIELLAIRATAGDREALTRLAERFDAPIRYYVRRLLGRDGPVADVTQEVWLAVIRQLPHLRHSASFVPWLYRIARNVAMQSMRGPHIRSLDPQDEPPAPADDEQERFRPEDAAAIHAALDELSQEHREVLALRFLEDQSYEEIADIVGCGLGTVRSRLFYAKRALRRQMELSYERS